ncbi:MAG: complement resistance protein TraT [Planctomycetota bacterium]
MGSFAGCRSVGKVLGNKDAEVRSGTVWNVPAPDIEPPAPSDRTVYIQVRNMSDASQIDLTPDIKSAVQDAGYVIVNDPTTANFRLRASLRFFGENEAGDLGRSQALALGGISGAGIGLGTAGVASAAGANFGIAAGAGAAAGGLAGIAIANRMQAREWNLIIDMILEEKLDEPITFEVASSRNRNSTTSTGNTVVGPGGGGNTVGGAAGDGTTRTGSTTKTSDYFPHGIRLTAWARQIGMTEDEALPELETKVRAVMPQILP